MSIPYVRERYRMPWLRRGCRVRTPLGDGTVTSATCHVWVRLDYDRWRMPFHPHDLRQLPEES